MTDSEYQESLERKVARLETEREQLVAALRSVRRQALNGLEIYDPLVMANWMQNVRLTAEAALTQAGADS